MVLTGWGTRGGRWHEAWDIAVAGASPGGDCLRRDAFWIGIGRRLWLPMGIGRLWRGVGVIGAVSARDVMASFGVGRTVRYGRLRALVYHGVLPSVGVVWGDRRYVVGGGVDLLGDLAGAIAVTPTTRLVWRRALGGRGLPSRGRLIDGRRGL
jgi:hypothetical protein